jgi:hypothetical protein
MITSRRPQAEPGNDPADLGKAAHTPLVKGVITRRSLADALSIYDGEIEALQLAKRAAYDMYRAQLQAVGLPRPTIREEIAAFKIALTLLQASDEKKQSMETVQDVAREIYAELNGAAGTDDASRASRAARDADAGLGAAVEHTQSGTELAEDTSAEAACDVASVAGGAERKAVLDRHRPAPVGDQAASGLDAGRVAGNAEGTPPALHERPNGCPSASPHKNTSTKFKAASGRSRNPPPDRSQVPTATSTDKRSADGLVSTATESAKWSTRISTRTAS